MSCLIFFESSERSRDEWEDLDVVGEDNVIESNHGNEGKA